MEKVKPEWTLVHESKTADVDKLYKVYALDKKKARILYFNNRNAYTTTRVVMFKQDNGDFDIVHFVETLGISITNKMYTRKKKVESLVYKGGKFYYITRTKKCTQLTYSGLRGFVGQFANWQSIEEHALIKSFMKKFSWIRFISEEPWLHGMAFNSIVRYKLYNLNDALKHKFKVPVSVVKKLKVMFKDYNMIDILKIWKEMKQVLLNPENLKPELCQHHLFIDTCKMARTLDKKVNCAWSIKRLTQEHDDWAKEITNTVLEYEETRDLKVNSIYKMFAEHSGYQLLSTNKDLLREGMMQKHCVGTYINKVDNGHSGIYHIQGYTLELCYIKISGLYDTEANEWSRTQYQYLSNVQFRGKFNKNAPMELRNEVEEKLLAFNKGLANKRGVPADMKMLTENKPVVTMFDVDLEDIVENDGDMLPF
jgi:hypothetical protein